MHNHGQAVDGGDVWLNLLPLWLQIGWVLVLAVCTAWAVLGLLTIRGPLRVAIGLHVLVCLGMVDMFAPWVGEPARATMWQITFILASVVAIGFTVRAYRHRRLGGAAVSMWVLIAVDCLAMTYMFQLLEGGVPVFTCALIAGFALLALGWAYGVFDGAHAPMCSKIPPLPGPLSPARLARTMQAAMAASMVYMFVLMTPGSGEFFGRAFTTGVTAQTYWALAFLALGLRMAFDPRLVRQLMGGFSVLGRRSAST